MIFFFIPAVKLVPKIFTSKNLASKLFFQRLKDKKKKKNRKSIFEIGRVSQTVLLNSLT